MIDTDKLTVAGTLRSSARRGSAPRRPTSASPPTAATCCRPTPARTRSPSSRSLASARVGAKLAAAHRQRAVAQRGRTAVARSSSIGRIPVGSYPTAVGGRRRSGKRSSSGSRQGPRRRAKPERPRPESPPNSDDNINSFQYLPSIVTRQRRDPATSRPTAAIRKLTPTAARADRPPPNTQRRRPARRSRPGGPIKHVFYIVRENRTYDQILGDDPRGDGDPHLTLFGKHVTPNVHALVQRFPLLDHVYANSEASIDGHFWTSAGAVSDYVVKNWHQNYAGRGRPTTSASTRSPGRRRASSSTRPMHEGDLVVQLRRGDRRTFAAPRQGPHAGGDAPRTRKFANISTLRRPARSAAATTRRRRSAQRFATGQDGLRLDAAARRADRLARRASTASSSASQAQLATELGSRPSTTSSLPPTTTPRARRPGGARRTAMIADNDCGLGQIVDLISHSPIWNTSLILVVEDDSQDGADHVDAHRIPALAISPYTQRGAVVHDRYD